MRPTSLVESIAVCTGAFLSLGLALWAHCVFTSDFRFIRWYFDYPAEVFFIAAAASQWFATRRLAESFEEDETLKTAWELATLAAALQLIGQAVAHGLATTAPWSPLAGPGVLIDRQLIRGAGLVLSGPISLGVLGFSLSRMLNAVRACGVATRWAFRDFVLLGAGVAFVVRHLWELAGILLLDLPINHLMVLNWAVDPVLLYVLYVAVRLWQSAREFGGGWVARCWQAYAAGFLLTFSGDVGLWIMKPWPADYWRIGSLLWFVWIPAAACYAAAPGFYLAAQYHARRLASQARPV